MRSLPRAVRTNNLKLIACAVLLFLGIIICFQGLLPSDNAPRARGHSKLRPSVHKLAVVVPYRNRFEELQVFVPYIHQFLNLQNIQHHIYIINQIDNLRFNRAALINAGFKFASLSTSYMVMHDVDLLPLNDALSYSIPEPGHVMHVAAPGLHPKYDYPTFVGGILIIRNEDFSKVNGMSNLYWGWGLEDDEFYVRLKNANIKVVRPTVSSTKADTFRHFHSNRPRDTTKCYDQWNKLRRRDRITGLSNLNYTLSSMTEMRIGDVDFTVVNIELHCNHELSPWCDCSKSQTTTKGKSAKAV